MKWPRIEPDAAADIEQAVKYFAGISPVLEAEFASALIVALTQIAKAPRRYARLETNKTAREIRRVILWRYNYLVIYKVDKDVPTVVAVTHGSREPDAWQSRESDS